MTGADPPRRSAQVPVARPGHASPAGNEGLPQFAERSVMPLVAHYSSANSIPQLIIRWDAAG